MYTSQGRVHGTPKRSSQAPVCAATSCCAHGERTDPPARVPSQKPGRGAQGPLLVPVPPVSIGSGTSIIRADEGGAHRRISGSCRGGGISGSPRAYGPHPRSQPLPALHCRCAFRRPRVLGCRGVPPAAAADAREHTSRAHTPLRHECARQARPAAVPARRQGRHLSGERPSVSVVEFVGTFLGKLRLKTPSSTTQEDGEVCCGPRAQELEDGAARRGRSARSAARVLIGCRTVVRTRGGRRGARRGPPRREQLQGGRGWDTARLRGPATRRERQARRPRQRMCSAR